jgi:hypothetical protein
MILNPKPRCSAIKNLGRRANFSDTFWDVGHRDQGQLEDTEIDHQIHKHMKSFMTESSLSKTPGHNGKSTDIHLWKQFSLPYFNSRTDEWKSPFRCPMAKLCDCKAQVCICPGEYNCKLLALSRDHNEHSYANDKRKKLKLKHKQSIAISNDNSIIVGAIDRGW